MASQDKQSANAALKTDSESSPDVADEASEAATTKTARPRMPLTRNLFHPTEYVRMMDGEFREWAFNEERAPGYKSQWRSEIYRVSPEAALDLEIGTGNGYHFAHLASKNPDRSLIGIELKYKPLIQSIRRALRGGAKNARILRYDASLVDELFAEGELNNVFIHHPDPWPKKRGWKHRLIQDDFLETLHRLMRPGSYVDFKTDSRDYFEWSIERFKRSKFTVSRETWDLHHSEWKDENFVTHFETLFLNQGQPIHYARLERK
jgi:tRNA (guanine-N7-)-methyltransferase